MKPGEVYLARFPFGDVPGMKLRPVLVADGDCGRGAGSLGGLHLLGSAVAAFAVGPHSRSLAAAVSDHQPEGAFGTAAS